jgi:HEAT repeat protein
MTGLNLCHAAISASNVAEPAELDPQLKLTKDALLDKGSSDQMRLNAAIVMLTGENPLAREILLDALKQTENRAVREALCKALIQTGIGKDAIEDVNDFTGPLLGVLAAENPKTARLAAEATLIFDYELISDRLDQLINDASVPLNVRLVAIYALELHPDMRAAIELLALVDNPQPEIAGEAKRALLALGIPVGEDAADRERIKFELIAEGPTAFLQRRLIRKESIIRRTKAELVQWQNKYLVALGDIYTAISEDEQKAEFLAEHLGGSDTAVRLWTLEKIRQDRVGTRPNPKLQATVGPILVDLISDPDADVRLKTANVLPFMTEVDSAEQLLAQLVKEKDDEVKTGLFSALGRACYIAFLPNSKIKIAPDIREQTLKWAVIYLNSSVPAKVQRGAEVLKMLLEQDGLTDSEADSYFVLLAEKFEALKSERDGSLRGEVLSAMATLCAPQSMHKVQSRKRFGPLFESALSDKTDLVREAAVDGLIYIDKAAALKRLRKDFPNDPSAIIRKKIIDLAKEVGGEKDLPWLAAKIGVNSESEPAWQAMHEIFNGADADVLYKWVDIFVADTGGVGASDSQRITFLKVAKNKANAENKPEMLQIVTEKLAALYMKTGQYERAAEDLARLYEMAATDEARRAILPDLLSAYLRSPQVDKAAKLVEDCLVQQDLDPNDAVIRSVDDYLAKLPAGADPNALLGAFEDIEPPAARPLWREILKQWMIRFGKAKAETKSTANGT